MKPSVVQLPLSMSNAYLVLGERPVLVDAGAPSDGAQLVDALDAHGVAPSDLALIALTHGHTDHTGGVPAVASGGAPVAIGAGDVGLIESGANAVLPPTGPAGLLLRPYIQRMTFSGVTPQIHVRGRQRTVQASIRREPRSQPAEARLSAGTLNAANSRACNF